MLMDRADPLGNETDVFGRRALHTIVGNSIDQPVPVFVTDQSPTSPEQVIIEFNAVTSVGTGLAQTILTYTVPALKKFSLQRVTVSGTNIAQYDCFVDSSQIGRLRTYFGGDLNAVFDFTSEPARGITYDSGQVINVTVVHQRPDLGDFEASMQGILIG
jgi:hypothetical protein